MRARAGSSARTVVVGALFCASLVSSGDASAAADTPVVIEGVGAAHGFGMAMDGVEGQARNGWSHSKILDLFYPGSVNGQAGGTIRVGLEQSPSPQVLLPNGGFVSTAPRGSAGAPGFPVAVPAGTKVSLRARDGGVAIISPSIEPKESTRQTPDDPEEPPVLVPPTAPPPPPIEPTPTPKKPKEQPEAPSDEKSAGSGAAVHPSVWVWGSGEPALVGVASTGRRYRGAIEVKPHPDGLVVVNHVDLETYVMGIAEEKGQGWPAAGLEVLAIAARSLGAATMTWYDKNQANGYDICPTANCQFYLGYDGEEPAMTAATRATAGVIRTFNGRPILAMYHGNGGGQTESYKRAIGGGSDPHPYLTSVKYPFADPSRWEHETTLGSIENALRAAGIAVPGSIERIGIAERGVSPRVLRVRVEGADGKVDISGNAFAGALELRSTWFELGASETSEAIISSDVSLAPLSAPLGRPIATDRAGSWMPALIASVLAGALLAAAVTLRRYA